MSVLPAVTFDVKATRNGSDLLARTMERVSDGHAAMNRGIAREISDWIRADAG